MGSFTGIIEFGATLLSCAGVIATILFGILTLRDDTRTRQISNLLAITSNHRQLWERPSEKPALKRVLDTEVNFSKNPITREEAEFVNMVILHTSSAHYALEDRLVIPMEGMRKDVKDFFSLPIPKAVWEANKKYQNRDFVEFVEDCRAAKEAEFNE